MLLSDTSALVLVMDKGKSYPGPLAKKFLSRLDLSQGRELYQKMQHLNPWLDTIVPNRKWVIHNFIRRLLKQENATQVLVLGCGWDPLLLQMSQEFPKTRFFGVDSESLAPQKKIIRELSPKAPIFYIQKDLNDIQGVLKALVSAGWQPNQPTCLVLEGIIYYIPPTVFWRNIKKLMQPMSANCFICGDISLDSKKTKITKRSHQIRIEVFEIIKEQCSHNYHLYGRKQIRSLLLELGCSGIHLWTEGEIQQQRTGKCYPWKPKEGPILVFTTQRTH